jgi:integrase
VAKLDHEYLWAARGRSKLYWYYRRNGRLIPIAAPNGRRLSAADAEFLEAYVRIHKAFDAPEPAEEATAPGSIARLIIEYRASPEFLSLAPGTRRDYGVYLDLLKDKHGHRPIATMPREAVFRLRDEFRDKPRKANYIVSILRLILSYAGDRRTTFRLPANWINPAQRPKKLREGQGHRPWEEVEIDAFRKRWPLGSLERVLFEVYLNSGQRGGDVAPMIRQQYYRGEISVAQEKTKERVWIPASRDLREALDPWLDDHRHLVMFPTQRGRPLRRDHMLHLMLDARRAAELPEDCTLHGLRYTFATRGLELGLDWQTIESIVGHRTAAMAFKYTAKRRNARLTIATLDKQLSPKGK